MKPRSFVILLISIGFIVMVVALFNSMAFQTEIIKPQALGGMPLNPSAANDPLFEQVKPLRPADIPVLDEGSGVYTQGPAKVVLWYGLVRNSSTAKDFVKKMSERVGQGGFTPAEPTGPPRLSLYRTTGGGMTHYIFPKENMVFWVATNGAANPVGLVQELLEFQFRVGNF